MGCWVYDVGGKGSAVVTSRSQLVKLVAILLCGAGSSGYAATVNFETVPRGTTYGKKFGNGLGETVLTQDGIAMSLVEFRLDDFVGFNEAEVGGSFDSWFKTAPLQLNNIGVEFDFAKIGFDVTQLTVEYIQFGGDSTFSVNGSSLMELVSSGNTSWRIGADARAYTNNGTLTIQGQIDSFQIAGQELAIDNIVAVPEPATAWLLALSSGWLLRRRRHRKSNEHR